METRIHKINDPADLCPLTRDFLPFFSLLKNNWQFFLKMQFLLFVCVGMLVSLLQHDFLMMQRNSSKADFQRRVSKRSYVRWALVVFLLELSSYRKMMNIAKHSANPIALTKLANPWRKGKVKKGPTPASFVYFRLLIQKIKVASRFRTWIIGVKVKNADH